MGAVAQAVGDFVGDTFESIGDIASDAVREIGSAVESVGREVGKIGQAAINDPIGTALKVGAVASGQWWALPLVSAGLVVANGGDIGQAALAAGISLAAQGVAYGVGEALGAAGSGVSDMMAADAASMSASGLGASQIADVLASSYGVAADIAATTADLATMGFTAAQIAADLGATYGSEFAAEIITPSMQNALANVAANSAGAGVRAVGGGGDLGDVLSAMGTAGLGTAVGAGTSSGLKDLGVGAKVAGGVGAATGAAAATAASGKDGTQAFLNSLINTTLREAGTQSKAILKQTWDKVTSAVGEYNEQLAKTEALRESTLTPLEKEAKAAEDAVNAELAAYKPVRDKFSDLVTRYDEAKAAGDVALANSLADQANALIPELNAATEKYNNVYNDYEAKLSNYKTGVETFKTELQKTDSLKATYETQSAELTEETKKLGDAVAKIEGMSEPVKEAFAQLYKNGDDVDLTLERALQLSKMDVAAQEGFIKAIQENPDTTNAFGFANKVNEFDAASKSAFGLAINKGLDTTTAFEVAPVISTFDQTQQQAYTNALKEGYGKEGADLISAFASFAPSAAPQAPAGPIAPQTRDIASEFVKLSPEEQLKYKELVNDPTNPMTAADALKAASDFFISPAQAGQIPRPQETIDPNNIRDAVYRMNPSTGKMGIFVPDGKGGFINTGAAVAFGGAIPQEGELVGSKYLVDNKVDENGVPSVSMLPYTGNVAPNAPTPGVMTPLEEAQYEKELAAAAARDDAALKNLDNKATTPSPTAPGPNTVSPSLPSKVITDADFTAPSKTPSRPAASTGAPSTAPTGGSATTGAPGTGGSGTGAPTTGGAGGGDAALGGTTPGTGTGGGTGTGTGGGGGGTGTGIGIGIGAGFGTGYGGWQALQSQDQYGGIKNLTPGLTQRSDYTLSGLPIDQDEDKVNPMMNIEKLATGGSATNTYDPFSTKDVSGSGISGSLVPGLSKAQINYILSGLPGNNVAVPGKAEGGSIEGHNPEFYSEGGLSSMTNRYVEGEGDGTSDSVPAMLANGEFVIPADVVSKIGNGSNEAGAGVLDQFLVEIRKHAHSNGEKLPPDSKGPLGYLLDAKRKVKA